MLNACSAAPMVTARPRQSSDQLPLGRGGVVDWQPVVLHRHTQVPVDVVEHDLDPCHAHVTTGFGHGDPGDVEHPLLGGGSETSSGVGAHPDGRAAQRREVTAVLAERRGETDRGAGRTQVGHGGLDLHQVPLHDGDQSLQLEPDVVVRRRGEELELEADVDQGLANLVLQLRGEVESLAVDGELPQSYQ